MAPKKVTFYAVSLVGDTEIAPFKPARATYIQLANWGVFSDIYIFLQRC